jgi:Fe-S cluster assembly protein SufD
MKELLEGTEFYQQEFIRLEQEVAGAEPAWIHRIRHEAFSRFTAIGFPTPNDEEWRHTDVAPLTRIPFQAATSKPPTPPKEDLVEATFDQFAGSQLVFLNGGFSRELSEIRLLPSGVIAGSLADILATSPEKIKSHLTRYADYEEHAFIALNTAFVQDGAFIYIPQDTAIEEPLHLVFASTAEDMAFMTFPRNLIVLGENSRGTIIESYIGIQNGVYFTNAVTELVLGKEARINHCAFQRESPEAFHLMTLAVHQDCGSRSSSTSVMLGGALARSEVHAVLKAEAIDCSLSGLYLAAGRQHVDIQTMIDHEKPGSTSRQVYKGILNGNASGVFKGRILVRENAQKTDAAQINQNLLLSEDAVVNTTPQLEIFADDVKCKHGTAVGHLDALRSRGLGEEAARNLMVYGFASEITDRIAIEPLRLRLSELLPRWISGGQSALEAS